MLRRACRDAAALLAQADAAATLAVNISSLQFRRPGFLEEVEQALAESGLAPERLELEVTESVLLDGVTHAIELIRRLGELGVRVALDDFGTGFSSLSYLRDLPIHKLKLDRAFIQDIATNRSSAAIVQGIITMAHHLELVVVAEGIEQREQQQDLARRHCDLLQGFYFARPMPREAMAIREDGGEAHALQADVRDDAQLEAMFGEITRHHGGVDVLVSNANMSFVPKPFMEQSWEEFSQKLNDEMHAAYQSARLAAESMKAKGFGRLVFISSTLSEAPAPSFIAHGSAKGALDSFTRYLAQELGPHGITANAVAPGLVETDATKDAPSEFKEMIRTHTPTQKIATPDDVANTVRYLASEASGHITGTYNPVCGGAYMS